jgi:hypothetical protein
VHRSSIQHYSVITASIGISTQHQTLAKGCVAVLLIEYSIDAAACSDSMLVSFSKNRYFPTVIDCPQLLVSYLYIVQC